MEEIEANDFEYKKAKAPDILTSGGLGPCIAVGAIYCSKGYLAHFSHIVPPRPELERLLGDLKKDVKNKSKLKIYIAGGGLDDCLNKEHLPDIDLKEVNKDILDTRKTTLKMIEEAGFACNIRKK